MRGLSVCPPQVVPKCFNFANEWIVEIVGNEQFNIFIFGEKLYKKYTTNSADRKIILDIIQPN